MSKRNGRAVAVAGIAAVVLLAAGLRVWIGERASEVSTTAATPGVANADAPTAKIPADPAARALYDAMLAQTYHLLPTAQQQRAVMTNHSTQDFINRGSSAQVAAADVKNPGLNEELWASLAPVHKKLLAERFKIVDEGGEVAPFCFTPDSSTELEVAFNEFMGWDANLRVQLANRWSATATDGGGLSQGEPTTLTYSFVPDGTSIPGGAPSDLQAYLNGIYGSPEEWKAVFAQVYERWHELAGITYVYEPNDDGAVLTTASGVLGVRGDVRVSGDFIDGSGGSQGSILAYNYYPDNADMVIDTGDPFFTSTANGSQRLRNVVAHEHGHGLGFAHSCPVAGTRLMEPFINLSFDGPQHDDVRAAQRHYGDIYELDIDNSSSAYDIGDLYVGTTLTVGENVPFPNILGDMTTTSIDDNGESDWYTFTIPSAVSFSATLTPIGKVYDDSPEACGGSCCSGNSIDSAAQQNLLLQVRAPNVSTVLATADANPAGGTETISGLALSEAGTYYLRVGESSSSTQSQLYTFEISAVSPGFTPLAVTASGVPTTIAPGSPLVFSVEIDPGDETVTGGSELLYYRFDGGSFLSTPLVSAGGNNWTATLPAAACGDEAEFYVSAVGDTSGEVSDPIRGAARPFTPPVANGIGAGFSDNFETDQGWVITAGVLRDGQWERGTVNGVGTGEPANDYDGSGQAFVTDLEPSFAFTDVDYGTAILTSPPIDISAGGELSYAYWANNNNANPFTGGDGLRVYVATNAAGADWKLMRTYQAGDAAWHTDTILVGTEVPTSSTVRVRFAATDELPNTTLEAAVDAVSVASYICYPADGDYDQDGDIDLADFRGLQECFDLAVAGACDNVDMNGDNVVDAADYTIWRSFLDASGPQ
ncbi:MAG: matrixin family metalloprotease [Phycisphaerales bacterium]|nr:matrixin family metalloprotease [Phycisphaerales bacterium]